MRSSTIGLFGTAVCWVGFGWSGAVGQVRRRRETADPASNAVCSLECHIVEPEVLINNGGVDEIHDDAVVCITQLPGASYRRTLGIDLPPTFRADHSHEIESGRLHLCINGGAVRDGKVVLTEESQLTLVEQHRRLQQVARRGRKRLLAVRVTSPSGEEPEESVELIQGAVFGTGPMGVTPSVISQYMDISHNQLEYVAARGNNIDNGVIEIRTETRVIEGKDIQDSITDDLLNRTEELIGPIGESVDNIIFCLPTGSVFQNNAEWTAFTYLFEPYSYYQQSRCTRLSVAVHELGHSIGFQHSGVGDNMYVCGRRLNFGSPLTKGLFAQIC